LTNIADLESLRLDAVADCLEPIDEEEARRIDEEVFWGHSRAIEVPMSESEMA